MNWDINTEEGRANAVAWFENFTLYLKPGGVWAIPRSRSVYRVDNEGHTITLLYGPGDSSTEKVAKAAGWDVFHA